MICWFGLIGQNWPHMDDNISILFHNLPSFPPLLLEVIILCFTHRITSKLQKRKELYDKIVCLLNSTQQRTKCHDFPYCNFSLETRDFFSHQPGFKFHELIRWHFWNVEIEDMAFWSHPDNLTNRATSFRPLSRRTTWNSSDILMMIYYCLLKARNISFH